MSKFLLITKINLQNFFDLKKVFNFQNKSAKKKAIYKTIFITAIVLYLAFYIYELFKFMLPGFIALNKPLYSLGYLFIILSFFILISNIFKIKSVLFDYKDYDLLNSLPIKRSTILFSKITTFYILNFLYTLIVMLPAYYAYFKVTKVLLNISYFFLLFIIPLVPLALSCLLGIILTWLTSFFKNKTIGSYIVNLSVIILALFYSFSMSNMDSAAMASNGVHTVEKMFKIYPLTSIFIDLLDNFHIVKFILFIFISGIVIGVLSFVLNRYYDVIRAKLLKSSIIDNYELKKYHGNNPVMCLYKKEIKRFFANSLYVINTLFGCIIILIFITSIIVFKDNTIAKLLSISDLSEFLKRQIFMILSLCCALSCTTHPSISLEGKSLWIMKTIPVSTDRILLSKLMVNLTFLVPTALISSTFFGIYLYLNTLEFLLLYIIPLAYAFFTAIVGLLTNLIFPRFDFDNEIRPIKQSMPAFLSIIIGLVSVVIPFSITNNILLITIIVIVVDVLLALALHFYAKKRFIQL